MLLVMLKLLLLLKLLLMLLLLKLLLQLKLLYNICRVPGFEPQIVLPMSYTLT